MTAETVLLRVATTLPAALAAWATIGLAVWALRIRAPRFCAALWALALVDTLLALAGWNAASVLVVRIVVPVERVAPFAPAALMAWAAVAALLLIRRTVAVRRLARHADTLHRLYAADAATVRTGERLALPPGDGTPFVAGLLRPVIVVPRAFWDRLLPDERDAMLSHELVHARRRDPLVHFVAASCADLLWPAFPLRWIARRLAASLEAAADAAAVRAGAAAPALARAVVAAAGLPSAPAHAWALGGGGSLVTRLDRLRRPTRRRVAAAQAVALAVLIPWQPGTSSALLEPSASEPGLISLGLRWSANPILASLLPPPAGTPSP